jgi:hypothetical protein
VIINSVTTSSLPDSKEGKEKTMPQNWVNFRGGVNMGRDTFRCAENTYRKENVILSSNCIDTPLSIRKPFQILYIILLFPIITCFSCEEIILLCPIDICVLALTNKMLGEKVGMLSRIIKGYITWFCHCSFPLQKSSMSQTGLFFPSGFKTGEQLQQPTYHI